MTFPAGGGSSNPGTPSGGSSPAAPTTPDSSTQTPPAASGDQAETGAATQPEQKPDATASTGAPQVKVERPASFREALESQRAAASGEARPAEGAKPQKPAAEAKTETPAPKAPAAKTPEQQPDTKTETPKAADAPDPATKPQPKPEAKPEKPATAPDPKQAAAPAAADDESPDDDDEVLKSEDLDAALEKRFPDADKGKRGALDFAKRMSARVRELAPVAEMIEQVGGVEGAKLAFDYTNALKKFATPAETPEQVFEQAESFRDFLHKEAPAAAAKLDSAIFWKAVEDTPVGRANVQALVDEMFGEGVLPLDTLKILGNAYAEGHIDLDELAERGDFTMSKAERERKARENEKKTARELELEKRLAAVEGKSEETAEAKEEARQTKVKQALTSFVSENFQLSAPILREYGFVLPDDQKSPEYKSMLRRIRHVQRDLEETMMQDDDYKAVIQNINALQTGGVHSLSLGAARNKMKVALRGILDELAPEAAAEVKRKNQLTATRVKQNGNGTTAATPARPRNQAPAADATHSEGAISAEDRRLGMKRIIDQGREAVRGT